MSWVIAVSKAPGMPLSVVTRGGASSKAHF